MATRQITYPAYVYTMTNEHGDADGPIKVEKASAEQIMWHVNDLEEKIAAMQEDVDGLVALMRAGVLNGLQGESV